MSLTYDDKNHAYYLDGRRLPSVTQVLGLSGLIPDYRMADTTLGSCVHALIAAEINGTEFDEGEFTWDTVDKARLYLPAWHQFCDDYGYVPQQAEVRLASAEAGYAGTIDNIGTIDGLPVTIEIKTGKVEAWHLLQLYGYEHLRRCQDTVGATGNRLGQQTLRYVVYLREDGYQPVEGKGHEHYTAFLAFNEGIKWRLKYEGVSIG